MCKILRFKALLFILLLVATGCDRNSEPEVTDKGKESQPAGTISNQPDRKPLPPSGLNPKVRVDTVLSLSHGIRDLDSGRGRLLLDEIAADRQGHLELLKNKLDLQALNAAEYTRNQQIIVTAAVLVRAGGEDGRAFAKQQLEALLNEQAMLANRRRELETAVKSQKGETRNTTVQEMRAIDTRAGLLIPLRNTLVGAFEHAGDGRLRELLLNQLSGAHRDFHIVAARYLIAVDGDNPEVRERLRLEMGRPESALYKNEWLKREVQK